MKTNRNSHIQAKKLSPETNALSFSTLFFLGLMVLIALGSVFLAWQRYTLQKENTEISQKIEGKQKTIQSLSKGDDALTYQMAATALTKAENYRIKWSEIVQKILDLETSRIQFTQFSSSPQKEVSIQGIASQMEDVARLLAQLKKDPALRAPFVSSLVEQEERGVSFQLTFSFVSSS
jgi:Tfp pilus assembly protein PilN